MPKPSQRTRNAPPGLASLGDLPPKAKAQLADEAWGHASEIARGADKEVVQTLIEQLWATCGAANPTIADFGLTIAALTARYLAMAADQGMAVTSMVPALSMLVADIYQKQQIMDETTAGHA